MAEIPSLRAFVRRWVPSGIRDVVNTVTGHAIRYRGPYPSWESARQAAAGYDDPALVERLARGARHAAGQPGGWEQDGVVHAEPAAEFPLLYGMLHAGQQRSVLRVLDFGGGFGSLLRSCRRFLPEALALEWTVVEQPALVAAARQLNLPDLRFHDSLAAALAAASYDVVLLSSVLQYLPKPYELLAELAAARIPYLIIDRHPYADRGEAIAVQVIPASLYRASYATWLFDRERFRAALAAHFEVVAEWDGKDPPIRGAGRVATFHGLLARRR